ncbi:MAG: M55 family metallopeptidase [Chthonomonadetes bacterium]|nr:M55 family metallopeptidase [Chthonomonadetes bacterium]
MRFLVSVDCEGLACVVGVPGGTLTDSPNYAFACRQAVREANAAVRALFQMGAEEVIVWDAHGGGVNLPYDELDERVLVALGSGFNRRFPGVDETFSGVLFIGYHAMDNTPDAVLAHSYSSKAYQWMEVNGEQVGEIAIDAASAGERNVPVIFVSGDDKCVAEARRFLPWVETVETKRAFGWNAALSKHPRRAERDIEEGVRRAVSRLSEMQVFRFQSPLTVRLRYKRLEDAERASRGASCWRRVDAYTAEAVFERISDWM